MAENLQPPTFQLPDADTFRIPTLEGLAYVSTSGLAFTPISPFRGRAASSNPAISAATTAVQTSADESQSGSDSSSGTDSDSAQSSAEEDSAEEDSAEEDSAAASSVAEGDEALGSEADTNEIESYLRDLDSNNVEGRHVGGDSDNDDNGDGDSGDDADSDDIDGGQLIFESDHEPSPEYDRAANHGFGHNTDKELEPAQILSDIVVPQVVGDLRVNPSQPSATPTPTNMATTIAAAAPTSTVPKKRKAGGEWDAARRKRVSEALKQRWADGRMAHVHDIVRKHNAIKAKEAKKAKGEALDTPADQTSASETKPKEDILDTSGGHPSTSEAKAQKGALDPSARYTSRDVAASGRAYREWEVNGVPHTTHGAILPDGYQVRESMALDKVPPATSSSVPTGARASMWAYVEPLLAKHRGKEMPHGGYVYELSILPRVRELNPNFKWQRTHPFMDAHPRDISAVIIQLTGEPAATPCDKCKEGRGPWNGCIMISSKAADTPLANIWSCANCFYHFGQTNCSHKSWGAERSRRILRSRGKSVGNIQAIMRSNTGQSKPQSGASKSLADHTPELHGESAGATAHSRDEVSLQAYDEDKLESDNQPLPPNNDKRDYELTKSTSTVHLTEDQKRLWNYIKPHLAFTDEVPEVGYIKELLSLPRVRDLVLPLSVPFAEKHTRDIAALIIQVTGEVLDLPCTRCRREQGPLFKGGCVAIKTTAHPEARRVYQGCANCTYDSKGGACSRGKGIPLRPQPPFPPKTPNTNKSTDGVWLNRGRAGGGGAWALAHAAPRPQRQAAAVTTSTSLVSAGDVQSADMFDMEQWEMAPGRILKSKSDKPIGFAYSKAFLSTGHTVPVCNDVQFQVKTIHTGKTITMDPDDGQTRLVSIATGKLRVKVGDEPEVMIGQHGMFRIEPGQTCTIENRVYVDATVHVTHLAGYF
ncbi:hypothetical protein QBC32DRAFT_368542 [Pseudoneurospora amorphoporcata]|uniref:Uncharacterized protein n=1 Tax=Pseudoneurospora amorphoporcata TaxID=241081 RepID=A0AAN6P2N4_9PEZI|nr:hypothetical protein QBC32DRAFT_368542 [Pseudoneurospora amorphoporcata]